MLGRIRQAPRAGLRVDWGAVPAWEVPLPAGVFGGDTVVAWAGFARGLDGRGPGERGCARLLADAAKDGDDGADGTSGRDPSQRGGGAPAPEVELARTCATAPAEGTDLARIAASRRLPRVDEAQALQLALDHQLVTDRTHCVLVHRRADEDKPTEDAELQRVESMLAAGWGGTGTVSSSVKFSLPTMHMDYSAFDTPSVWRSGRTASAKVEALSSGMDELEIPAFLRKQHAEDRPMTLADIARGVADYVRRSSDMAGLSSHCRQWPLPDRVQRVFDELARTGIDEVQVWLALAAWVGQRAAAEGHGPHDSIDVTDLAALSTLDAKEAELVHDALQRHLGAMALIGWPTRGERLAQRMRVQGARRRHGP
jgi:hypothetical protein